MALSEDQRAMLRLLAQREQGYDDIAALMGLSVDEVRAKVREALDQLEAAGETAPPIPEPLPPAPEPEPPAEPPAPAPPPPTPAEPVVAEPVAEAAPAASTSAQRPRPKLSLPGDPGLRTAIVAGALVLVALIVILVVAGGDDGSGDATAGGNTPVAENGEGGEQEPTVAVLESVDGGNASGTAAFGAFEESPVLAIEARGLKPSGKGEQYAISLAASPNRIIPIAATAVGKNGKLEASVRLPVELLFYLADETYTEVVISLADTARLEAEIKKEAAEPSYTGTAVLRGTITGPLVGNQELVRQVEEAKAKEEEGKAAE